MNTQRWRSARSHQPRQTRQIPVLGMQAGGRAVVLDAQPQLTALGIGEADDGLDQLAVGELFQVAFEFDRQRLGGRQALAASTGGVAGVST